MQVALLAVHCVSFLATGGKQVQQQQQQQMSQLVAKSADLASGVGAMVENFWAATPTTDAKEAAANITLKEPYEGLHHHAGNILGVGGLLECMVGSLPQTLSSTLAALGFGNMDYSVVSHNRSKSLLLTSFGA